MSIYRKEVNKNHPNYGRRQHPKTQMAAKINWLRLQVTGAGAHLTSASYGVTGDPMFSKLKPEYQERIRNCAREMRNIAQMLGDLQTEIADLNSPNKWVD